MVMIELAGIQYSLQQQKDVWVLRGLGNMRNLCFSAESRTAVLGEWADFIYRSANGEKDFASDILAEY